MDGNRRWAARRGLPRWAGHRRAIEKNIEAIILAARALKIPYLTLFAWSTENWQRSPREIKFIFNILRRVFENGLAEIKRAGIKIQIWGEIQAFPRDLQKLFQRAVRETAKNKALVLNLCLSYGGRAEIVRAIREILKADHRESEVNERLVRCYLYGGSKTPDPDLIIRTSGEQRLSNFLLWQSAYSELLFLPVYWPDFTPRHLRAALKEWNRRERRFGR